VIRVTHVLDSRVEIKLVRRNGTKAVWQRNGGGTVKTRKSIRSATTRFKPKAAARARARRVGINSSTLKFH